MTKYILICMSIFLSLGCKTTDSSELQGFKKKNKNGAALTGSQFEDLINDSDLPEKECKIGLENFDKAKVTGKMRLLIATRKPNMIKDFIKGKPETVVYPIPFNRPRIKKMPTVSGFDNGKTFSSITIDVPRGLVQTEEQMKQPTFITMYVENESRKIVGLTLGKDFDVGVIAGTTFIKCGYIPEVSK